MGAISGAVRDASGAVVPDAQVVVSNESKGIRRNLRTTEAGVFAAPSLVPAAGYVVTVTKQGFSNYEVKDIQVQVGQNVDLAVAADAWPGRRRRCRSRPSRRSSIPRRPTSPR